MPVPDPCSCASEDLIDVTRFVNKNSADNDNQTLFPAPLLPSRLAGFAGEQTLELPGGRAYLDSIGFSGFTTAMQAIECGLPIVTMEGRFMRGRLASGILRTLGVDELVVSNEDDYVSLAVRLATDAEFRQRVRERIERSSAAPARHNCR